jgi:retinol-binding protein 3
MKHCLVPFLLAAALLAQGPPPGPDMAVDAAARNAVIDGALKALNEGYIFPAVAAQMERAIRDRQHRNEYDSITSARQFASKLTNDLREVSHDKHLRVDYVSRALPPQPAQPPSPEELLKMMEQQRVQLARINFGFEKLERLPGNIGYLDLRAFTPAALTGETAAAAMNFLSNSEAVIIDLRKNGGGDPATVSLIASYLFGPQPVHLNDLYNREHDETRQFWTLPYVPGRKLFGKDVYVLTSSNTFSGGEEFTYDLKTQKRATIVGETTGGGAHPVGGRRINDHFIIGVPSGRPINPITKTDWEGTGVEPDVKVPAEQALSTAHLMALEKLLPTLSNAPGVKAEAEQEIERLKKELGK